MRKYWAVTKTSIQETLAYRGPMLIWLFANMISALVMISVWSAVNNPGLIGGYQKSELITYYILSLFLSWIVLWFPFNKITHEIQEGQIGLKIMVKPISFYVLYFFQEIGWHVISSLVGLVTSLFLFISFKDQIYLSLTFFKIFLLLPATTMAILLTYTMSVNMALLAFWFTQVGAIESFFWVGRSFLGGTAIPISFLPDWITNVVILLPFRYMFSFPLEIVFGKVNFQQIVIGLVISVIWYVILYLLYRWLWKKGCQAYSSYGH